jgi:hypothetical protein
MDIFCNLAPHIGMAPLHFSYFDKGLLPVIIFVSRCEKTVQTLRDDFRRPECIEQSRDLLRVDGDTSLRYGEKLGKKQA